MHPQQAMISQQSAAKPRSLAISYDFPKTITLLKHSLLKQIAAIQKLYFATKANSFNWYNVILQQNDLEY